MAGRVIVLVVLLVQVAMVEDFVLLRIILLEVTHQALAQPTEVVVRQHILAVPINLPEVRMWQLHNLQQSKEMWLEYIHRPKGFSHTQIMFLLILVVITGTRFQGIGSSGGGYSEPIRIM